jgi:hypothetical protein
MSVLVLNEVRITQMTGNAQIRIIVRNRAAFTTTTALFPARVANPGAFIASGPQFALFKRKKAMEIPTVIRSRSVPSAAP